jgi:hypothetical protein
MEFELLELKNRLRHRKGFGTSMNWKYSQYYGNRAILKGLARS